MPKPLVQTKILYTVDTTQQIPISFGGDWWNYFSNVDVTPNVPYGLIYSPSQEYYFEAKTEDEPGSANKWKSIEHYKRSFNVFAPFPNGFYSNAYTVSWKNPQDRTCSATPTDPYWGWHIGAAQPITVGAYQPWIGFEQLYQPGISSGAFVPPPDGLSNLIQASLDAMLPSIKEELSLINSVIELKDFKSLVSGIIQHNTTFKRLNDFFKRHYRYDEFLDKNFVIKKVTKKAVKDVTVGTLADLVRLTAGDYLQYKFNIQPLISDINGIYRSLSRVERQINDLIARSGSPRTRHFRRTLADGSSESTLYRFYHTLISPSSVGTYVSCRRTRTRLPSEFHAEIEYNYNFTQYQLEHARVLALLDAFGVNLNPAIIWNAIPYTFLVDWVIGVSRFLENFKVQNMEPKINILRYLWSVKRVQRIDCNMNYDPFYETTIPNAGSPMPTVSETAYRRQVQMPSASSIKLSGLNSSEFTLGAALVLSRRRKSRK